MKIGAALYRENVDAAAIDHFIAEEVTTDIADPNRIYVTGWSNGAAMALLYALNRPRVAAVAVYSAPDPFGAFDDPCPAKAGYGHSEERRRSQDLQSRRSHDAHPQQLRHRRLVPQLRAAKPRADRDRRQRRGSDPRYVRRPGQLVHERLRREPRRRPQSGVKSAGLEPGVCQSFTMAPELDSHDAGFLSRQFAQGQSLINPPALQYSTRSSRRRATSCAE